MANILTNHTVHKTQSIQPTSNGFLSSCNQSKYLPIPINNNYMLYKNKCLQGSSSVVHQLLNLFSLTAYMVTRWHEAKSIRVHGNMQANNGQ